MDKHSALSGELILRKDNFDAFEKFPELTASYYRNHINTPILYISYIFMLLRVQ